MENDFGAHLKHEREMRGITLDEVSQATKIHLRYLNALENNDFDQLPGEVFIKGFIRSYAKVIGADVEELLTFYDDNAGRERRDQAQKNWEDSGESQRKEQLKIVNTLLGGFLGVFLLVGIIFLIQIEPEPEPIKASRPSAESDSQRKTKPTSAGDTVSEENEPTDSDSSGLDNDASMNQDSEEKISKEPEGTEKSIPKNQNGVIIQGQQNQTASVVSAPEKEAAPKVTPQRGDGGTQGMAESEEQEVALTLEIRVRENGWFNLIVDGTRQQDFILPAGSKKQFQASDSIRITLGNRRGTDLVLNGKTLSLPAGRDNVVRDFLINSKQVQ